MKVWHNLPDAAKDAAIAWHVRLTSGKTSDADYEAFGEWMADDTSHVAAMDYVESHAAKLESLRGAHDGSLDHLADVEQLIGPAALSWNGRRRAYAAIAATLMIAFAGAGIWLSLPSSRPETARYASNDALELVTLSDGTTVMLAPGASMEVLMEKRARKVTSFDGLGYFRVVSDKSRPFAIAFGDAQITVVGTQFEVRSGADMRTVVVTEGLVTVSAGDDAIRLARGDRLRMEGPDRALVDKVDPEAVSKWRNGFLEFENAPIAEMLQRLNELYGEGAFTAAEGGIDQIRFSGVIVLSDPASVARRMEEILPVAIARVNGRYELSGRNSSRK